MNKICAALIVLLFIPTAGNAEKVPVYSDDMDKKGQFIEEALSLTKGEYSHKKRTMIGLDYDKAEQMFTAMKEGTTKRGPRIFACYWLAEVNKMQADYDAAIQHYTELIAMLEATGTCQRE